MQDESVRKQEHLPPSGGSTRNKGAKRALLMSVVPGNMKPSSYSPTVRPEFERNLPVCTQYIARARLLTYGQQIDW